MRVYAHATFEIKRVIFHVLSPVSLIIEVCVSVAEHGFLNDLAFPVRDVLVVLIPCRALTFSLTSVIYFPASEARAILEMRAHFLRDIN